MSGRAFAAAAARLVGCRFRLHGREPETGLDCVGVIAAALEACGIRSSVPSGYRLRTGSYPDLEGIAAVHGFASVSDEVEPGDVLVTQPGPAQLHFAIAAPGRNEFVEAHAGLGRVVMRPGPLTEAIVAHWRFGTEQKEQSWQP